MNRQRTQVLVAIALVALAFYGLRHTLGLNSLLIFAVIIPSIILHEISHGVAALAFGDRTAKEAGRITLNPIPHIDPIGTLLLPGIMSLVGFGAFGYAKPVPVNPGRMRHPRNDSLIVSLVGPLTNLAIAAVATVVLRFGRPVSVVETVRAFGLGAVSVGDRILFLAGFLNVILAVFNLLPIPPLDGSAVVERLLPRRWWPAWLTLRQYSMGILLVLILLGGNVLQHIFQPAEQAWGHLVGLGG
jgi:Zn-dependent protease